MGDAESKAVHPSRSVSISLLNTLVSFFFFSFFCSIRPRPELESHGGASYFDT